MITFLRSITSLEPDTPVFRELVKNSKKDSNCYHFEKMVESTHAFGCTIYFVILTITSSGDKYIMTQMHIMFIVPYLKEI